MNEGTAVVEKDNVEAVTDPFQTEVELPSKGQFYPNGKPGTVMLRPITVEEEKVLSGQGRVLDRADRILQKCIISECIPLKELLLTDKFYLLLNLRSISYGPEYSFQITCSSCQTEFKKTIALPDGLELRIAEKDDKEPFDVILPVSKKTVSLRFLRGFDEDEIEEYVKTIPETESEGDPGYIFRLSRFIDKIDGQEIDSLEKLNFCKKLIGRDSMAIRRGVGDHETGARLNIDVKCPSCQTVRRVFLPLTNEFFPSSDA